MPDIEEVTEELEPEETEETDDIETTARDMGWVPEDAFKGDPAKWTPAADWVQRGENYIPIMRKENKDLRGEVSRLKSEQSKSNSDHQDRFARLEKMQSSALVQQRDQLVAQYGERKRDAVERGDTDAYDAVEQAERVALTDLAKQTVPEPVTQSPVDKEIVEPWLRGQKWFGTEKAMTSYATAISAQISQDRAWLSTEDNLEETLVEVKKRFPESPYFASKTNRGSPVETGTRTGGLGSSRGMYAKLPTEAKEQCDIQIKDGQFQRNADGQLIKETSKRRERYAQLYFGDDNE